MKSKSGFLFGRLFWFAIVLAASLVVTPKSRAGNFYQGISPTNAFFPGGVVPYLFDTNITAAEQEVYLDGMREWELAANVHFVPYTNQPQFVLLRFDYQQGTDTFVLGNPPVMTVDTLSRSQVGHETGHLLGFQHEHVRIDRNNFITVNFTNLISDASDTNGSGEQGGGILGLYLIDSNSTPNGAYDFESVMHYGRTLFSKDPDTLDVLVPNPPYIKKYYNRIGNYAISVSDRAAAAYLYGPPPTPLTNVVTTTADVGFGSLRAAMYYANDHPGTTVRFAIPTSDPGYSNGVYTIYLTGELPPLVADGTVIDGTSQPGFAGQPVIAVSGARLIPEISYTNSFYSSGFRIFAANCTLRGLAINHFPDTGVYIEWPYANSNHIEGCYVGLAPGGTNADGNTFEGIALRGGVSGTTIGGVGAGQGNVICGNGDNGLDIRDTNTIGTTILGNYIGTDAGGNTAIGNNSGIFVFNGPTALTIGGTTSGARNVISGNRSGGVYFLGPGLSNNVIQGNYIGLNAAGTAAVPNIGAGVYFFGGVSSNLIGGTAPGAGNVISGSLVAGLYFSDPGTFDNVIQGNILGLNATGTAAITNGFAGINLWNGVSNTLIGGTVSGAANIISGNFSEGIFMSGAGTISNYVVGNFIGTGPGGAGAFGNGGLGVGIWSGSANNVVGGTNTAARNIISGNGGEGISILGAGTTGNQIYNNYVGLTANGAAPLPNAGSGIYIVNGAQSNSVGGVLPGEPNVVSGNGGIGIEFYGAGTSWNPIYGNYVGVSADGLHAVPNGGAGIYIGGGASSNAIGGPLSGQRNVISANNNDGVQIYNSSWTTVQGNLIGTDVSGQKRLGNAVSSLSIFGGSAFNTVGGTSASERNILAAGTNGEGLYISDTGTSNNVVQGNYIGTDITGALAFGNGGNGINVGNGAQNNIIGGTAAGAGNVVSANLGDGMQVYGEGTISNLIQGNLVGTTATGHSPLGNSGSAFSLFSGAQFNLIGGTSAAARNLFTASTNYDGVYISGASGNIIQGNYIGTDASGMLAYSNGGEGLTLFGGAQSNLIGGAVAGAGNVIAGSTYRGIFISDAGTVGNVIQGNYIGVAADGITVHGGGLDGIVLDNGASNNLIGGVTAVARNVIVGNGGAGIWIGNTNTDGNSVEGNYIGVCADGVTAAGNQNAGILILLAAQNNVVGLDVNGAGAGNVIANNLLEGVAVYYPDTVGNTIRGNTIYNNGRLGINLAGGTEDGFGVTANHAGGAVAGPNDLQNYPIVTSAISSASTTAISGTLNSTANRVFRIDIYRDAARDSSGHGQAQIYLGSTNLNTGSGGNGSFTFTGPGDQAGQYFTATATDVTSGDTSEFSADVAATSAAGPIRFVGPFTWSSANGFSLAISLTTNLHYRVQASTNLATTNWVDLTNFTATNSPVIFQDRSASNRPVRFYRVVSP